MITSADEPPIVPLKVQQAQQQQVQQGVAGTELYAMDYESLGSAASGTFHPIAPSALHFGPFAPQFSSQVHLTPEAL